VRRVLSRVLDATKLLIYPRMVRGLVGLMVHRPLIQPRLIALLALLACVPIAAALPSLAALTGCLLILAVLIAFETIHTHLSAHICKRLTSAIPSE
jgi:hypothetical protein